MLIVGSVYAEPVWFVTEEGLILFCLEDEPLGRCHPLPAEVVDVAREKQESKITDPDGSI